MEKRLDPLLRKWASSSEGSTVFGFRASELR